MFGRTKTTALKENAASGAQLAAALAKDKKFRRQLVSAVGHGAVARGRGVDWDAWNDGVIPSTNEFNDPPPPGWTDVMVNLSATYVGSGSANLSFDFIVNTGTVGASNVLYVSFNLQHDCGVLPSPNELDFSTIYSGGTATFNNCWQVPSGDVSSLEFVYTPWSNGFFALR